MYEAIKMVKSILTIPVMVMVRPRGGNYKYSTAELDSMKQDIDFCKETGVQGIVFGFLTEDNRIDTGTTAAMAAYASPLQITFHKAIDDTPDPAEAVKELLKIKGITRILTSGGKATALEGAGKISQMIDIAGDKIIIMTAGRVTSENLAQITDLIPGKEFHGRKIVGELGNIKPGL
jgi:copper homeostasis protein